MITPIYYLHFGVMVAYILMLALYLLLSKRNAFGCETVDNNRLRRMAGQMLLFTVFTYIANIPILTLLTDIPTMRILSISIDVVLAYVFQFRFMLSLLQDRQRWSPHTIWAGVAIIAVCNTGWFMTHDHAWVTAIYVAYAASFAIFAIHYTRGLIEYRRFLMNNYADIERKESMWSLVMLVASLMMILSYSTLWQDIALTSIIDLSYFFHFMDMAFMGFVTWRIDQQQVLEEKEEKEETEDIGNLDNLGSQSNLGEPESSQSQPDPLLSKIESMLQRYCIKKQLYLRHDLTLTELAKACGTNRTYLSRYFSSQGITYNAYINSLRIDHFKRLYVEAAKDSDGLILDTTLQQLAAESGFRSYDTFTRAFRTHSGISMRQWLKG